MSYYDLKFAEDIVKKFTTIKTKEEYESFATTLQAGIPPDLFAKFLSEYILLRKMEQSLALGTTKYKVYVEELYRQRKTDQLSCPYLSTDIERLQKSPKFRSTMLNILMNNAKTRTNQHGKRV